jgi:hypothetical protein
MAVAAPAGAQPRQGARASQLFEQIVTKVARASTLTMKSGYSHYLFVGGSSAGAAIENTTFGHYSDANCGHPRSQGPLGPSAATSPEGSFTTTGAVAVIAGVATTGYSLRHLVLAGLGTFACGSYPSRIPAGNNLFFGTGTSGGVVLILVGTEGVGTLAPSLSAAQGYQCVTSGLDTPATLQNVTASRGHNVGGAVGVFSVSVAPESGCFLSTDGTSYNKPGTGNFGIWAKAYLLVPEK